MAFGGSYEEKDFGGGRVVRYYDDGRTEWYQNGVKFQETGGVQKQQGSFSENIRDRNALALLGNVRDVLYDASGADMFMSGLRGGIGQVKRTGNIAPSFSNIARGGLGLAEGALNIGTPVSGVRGYAANRAAGSAVVPALGRSLSGFRMGKGGKTTIGSVLSAPGIIALQGANKPAPLPTLQALTRGTTADMAERRATTGQTNGYNVSPYGAMPIRPAATEAAAGATGGAGATGTAGTTGASTLAVPAGGLAANDPAVQAALNAERIAAEEELRKNMSQLGLARVRGSVEDEAALRDAARAATGGAVDVAGAFGEAGLGYSPATLQSALERLRTTEAETRRDILGGRTARQAEAAGAQESLQRAYERVLQAIRAREIGGRVGQTIGMIQPYLGGA